MQRILFLLALLPLASCAATPRASYDLVVYGGSSAGVAAARTAAEAGRSVCLLAPSGRLGGLSASGLGATDSGNRKAIGGLARAFYREVREHYESPASWTREARADFTAHAFDEDAMWRFEPHVAEAIFERWADHPAIEVRRGEWLSGARVRAGRIEALELESGRSVRGSFFVDATYEGDLLAAAGVSFTIGRESNARYGESLNGVQTANARHHQFVHDVDPFVEPGDPASGLLPGIRPGPPGDEGSGDARLQAYNFRLCLTDDPENRVPFTEPADYDARDYELLLRHFDAGASVVPWHSVAMPNRKTDTNNNRAFSTDFIGANWGWPEAERTERERLWREHERYQRGLLWTLASHPRVPATVRAEVSRWGLARDEFTRTGNWPHALYVREGRRMVADYVVTELDCDGTRRPSDPIALGAYTMDSHNVQRYVDERGFARNEGDVQVPPSGPYPVSYRALVPRAAECTNLFVPVCVSASHIAYGSIRMEPVFLALGEVAGVAADLALTRGCSVQDVPYPELARALTAGGSILEWNP